MDIRSLEQIARSMRREGEGLIIEYSNAAHAAADDAEQHAALERKIEIEWAKIDAVKAFLERVAAERLEHMGK